jgi:DNA-binding transcriptional ArsR family regulator
MDELKAMAAFAALSQKTRLDVFRLLIKAGEEGMFAGEISDALDVRQNTMSANLSVLLNAGLVKNTREGRAIRYYIDFNVMRELLQFLMADCCGGAPEKCLPLIDDIICIPNSQTCSKN